MFTASVCVSSIRNGNWEGVVTTTSIWSQILSPNLHKISQSLGAFMSSDMVCRGSLIPHRRGLTRMNDSEYVVVSNYFR